MPKSLLNKTLRLVSMAAVAPIAVSIMSLVMATGCKSKPPVTPPPPPFRPEPVNASGPGAPTKTDCDPPNPAMTPDAKTYAERAPRIDEAKRLSEEGLDSETDRADTCFTRFSAGVGRLYDEHDRGTSAARLAGADRQRAEASIDGISSGRGPSPAPTGSSSSAGSCRCC